MHTSKRRRVGSIVLAAIALKLGAYGFLRFSLPIVPDASHAMAPFVIGLSLIAVIYIGFVALVQTDMKKLVAYSSISHSWNINANKGNMSWATGWNGKSVMTASHRASGGVPTGGQFLFEDGHVEWRGFKLSNARETIDVGSMKGSWVLFYKPPNIQTNL